MIATTLGLSHREIAALDARTPIDNDGDLGVDSLDLIALAKMVSRFFDLYASGAEEYLLQRRTVGGWTRTVLEACSGAPTVLTFRTSGSTGEPTDCPHTVASLSTEVGFLISLFADRSRVVTLVPQHHIYGFLFTLLLPNRLGVPLVDLRGASAAEIARTLEPGDLLIGFPLRWDELADAGIRLSADVVGVTSTGPARAATIARLRERGLARMVEIYGSSQTAGIAWRDDPADPYRLFPYWTLAESGDRLLRNDRTDDSSGSPLPDRVVARGDGFDVVGRIDGAVSIGGVNVYPERIADIIRSHTSVSDCSVRPMRSGEGERLKAFVVLAPAVGDPEEAQATLRRWLRATLGVAECPKPVTFGEELPRDTQGKIADW